MRDTEDTKGNALFPLYFQKSKSIITIQLEVIEGDRSYFKQVQTTTAHILFGDSQLHLSAFTTLEGQGRSHSSFRSHLQGRDEDKNDLHCVREMVFVSLLPKLADLERKGK